MTTESQFPAHLYDIDPEEDTALLQDVLGGNHLLRKLNHSLLDALDPADFLVKQRLRRDAKVLGQPESRVHRTLSISEEDRAQMSMVPNHNQALLDSNLQVMDPVEYEIEEDVRQRERPCMDGIWQPCCVRLGPVLSASTFLFARSGMCNPILSTCEFQGKGRQRGFMYGSRCKSYPS